MPSIVKALYTIQCLLYLFMIIHIYFFPVKRKTHCFIEIAKLPGDLNVALVTVFHLIVEYGNVM